MSFTPFPFALAIVVLALRVEAGELTPAPRPPAKVVSRENRVEFRRPETNTWYEAPKDHALFERDHLRTLETGRAVVEMQNLSQLRLNPLSELVITPARSATTKARLEILRGLLYFLHRNRPGEIEIVTPAVTAAIEGTDFVLSVDTTGSTVLTVLDGRVELINEAGRISLLSGEQGTANVGQPPRKTAVIEAKNALQWCLYYPAVLDPDELGLPSEAQEALAAPLAAYQAGDILGAISLYPSNRTPASVQERLFLAALELSSGRTTNYQSIISGTEASHPLARALGWLIAAITSQTVASNRPATNASQWLGVSYYRQSQHDLPGALEAARNAVEISQGFAFGWVRLTELEFSFGHTTKALEALELGLALAPRNAQAHALHGFVLLARDRSTQAEAAFERAMELDPMLANAWLGRGLSRIHRRWPTQGRADLQTAAVLEPNRWLLRSYLGKAYAHEAWLTQGAGQQQEVRKLAATELELAKQQDPLDPTPWLYSALLCYDEYRTAEAIHDLEESKRLNDNRQLYRSRLLLDQDQAVRSANLANIFRAAEMDDVSVRESARAVAFDYGNFSAHFNLASSFDSLRDPTRFNLRYESAWFNEHLLASLLAPPGAGWLSQNLSQQEYSRLFATDRIGLQGASEYLSTGEFRQTASQFGSFGPSSYALDLEYQHNEGVRPNNDLTRLEWYSRIKQQLTPEDSILVLAKYEDYNSGDNFQYYNPRMARPSFRFQETQAPLLLAGWHHEWAPGVHTLFLGGRLENEQHFSDTNAPQLLEVVNPPNLLDPTNVAPFDVSYRNNFEIYSAELNQIVQRERHTDIFGGRFQQGDFNANATMNSSLAGFGSATDADFRRISVYGYHHWEIVDGIMLIGGVAYENEQYPANFRRPPLSSENSRKKRWLPKSALVWTINPAVTLRGIYAQALGGVSYDESVRLEPTQLAGFDQSFRSIISESLIGSVEAPDYEIGGGALDLKLSRNTWLSLQGQTLTERLKRPFGLIALNLFGTPPVIPTQTSEHIDYGEMTLRATFNQLVGRDWFFEVQYQFSRSELERTLPDIGATPTFVRTTTSRADLHEVRLATTWQVPRGFFARGEFWWLAQNLDGSSPQPSGDRFPQINLYAGYRFPNRRAELTVGGLNLTGGDYHLSPLNYYLELPRERAFYMRLRFNF